MEGNVQIDAQKLVERHASRIGQLESEVLALQLANEELIAKLTEAQDDNRQLRLSKGEQQ